MLPIKPHSMDIAAMLLSIPVCSFISPANISAISSATDEKDIPLIICDRYKLSNFHINKEILQTESGINEIITNANNIEIYTKIVQKISYDNLKFIIEAKDILNK